MELVRETYAITLQFPPSERYGITSQMQRAAVAIPSNIAEGFHRKHTKEYCQFLSIAFGSGAEIETQIEICKSLPHLPHFSYTKAEELLGEVMRMLNALIHKLNKTNH